MKGFQIARMAGVLAILGTLAALQTLGQAAPAPGGARAEPSGPRIPEGRLGGYLGQYITIEGARAEDGKVGTRTLVVDTVDGKKLAKPISIWVQNLELPSGKRCVLKGYESGEMIGIPPAVHEADREQGLRHRGEVQAAWQWHAYFVALIAVEPKGLKIPKQ